ncbi:nicotinamide/nicotinic acid mononucleotide adenylyltransferase 1-like [Paramormyrops kingsleyae]|uniref:nicotinamide/nicotinic acid mononucleotide adenylyltransferase 1-like n=1 Tax=Paramormyrops kingsleyae TaxID=1676925 RepID=UPI003B978EB6
MSRKRPIASAKRAHTARSFDEVPKKTKVVLLSCGSYNPVTNTKLCMFEGAREHLQTKGQYEVVKGIISPVADGYNKKGLIEASHRVEMAKLAVENHSWIEVDSWESRQAEWLETVKVLRHHRQELLSQEPDTDVVGTTKAGRKRKRMDASSATKRRKLEEAETAPKEPPQEPDTDVVGTATAGRKRKRMDASSAAKRRKLEEAETAPKEPPQEPDTDVVGTATAGRKRKRMDASSATKRRKLEEAETAPKGTPQKTDEPRLMLLCDAELLDSFVVPGLWKPEHIEEIVSNFGLVCMAHYKSNPEAIIRGSDLLWPHYRNIYVVRDWVGVDVSSTYTRQRMLPGYSARYLINDLVLRYIQERRLYTPESEQRNADVLLAPLQKLVGNHG